MSCESVRAFSGTFIDALEMLVVVGVGVVVGVVVSVLFVGWGCCWWSMLLLLVVVFVVVVGGGGCFFVFEG